MPPSPIFGQFEEAKAKLRESRDLFIKQILIIASSLLGILVSLHKTPLDSVCVKTVFMVTISLLTLGIISLSIALYANTHYLKQYYDSVAEELRKRLEENHSINVHSDILFFKLNGVYGHFEKLGYFILILSAISLATYGGLIA